MVVEVKIPKLGLTMKEAKIQRWKVSQGDWVKKGEVILVIETDKVSYEIEAPESGYISILLSEEGPHQVGTTVALIATEKMEHDRLMAEKKVSSFETRAFSKEMEKEERVLPPLAHPEKEERRIKSSPIARKMAEEYGIDLLKVRGTGPGGRIVREDIIRAVEERKEIGKEGETIPFKEIRERIRMDGMRRIISERMHESLMISAQMTLTMEVDVTELMRLRKSLIKRYEKEGLRISYNAILVRICAVVLKEHPRINSSIQGDELILWKSINIGVAMELHDGLIVPVVKNADKKVIHEIHRELEDLHQRAMAHRLLPDEIQGGTFTLTNLGSLDIDAFTPIINQPENAILGIGRMVERPFFSQEGRIVKKSAMVLSLTCDHRAIDGAHGARFLKRIKEYIEDPYLVMEEGKEAQ